MASGTAPHGAQQYVAGDPVNDMVYQYPDGHFETLDFYSRFRQAKKPIQSSYNDNGDALGLTHTPNELRPYRDQTVFYGQFTTRNASEDETPPFAASWGPCAAVASYQRVGTTCAKREHLVESEAADAERSAASLLAPCRPQR